MSILDKYGIKEVADVTFYEINSQGKADKPVLYLDTLKVSTIEQTAEQADARGGKGNPKLITWDYGKEISVTLEDALFSAKSMALMFGDGSTTGGSYNFTDLRKTVVINFVNQFAQSSTNNILTEAKLSAAVAGGSIVCAGLSGSSNQVWYNMNGKTKAQVSDYTVVLEDGTQVLGSESTTIPAGTKAFLTFNYQIANAGIINIDAMTFPGTYYITGDTYARSAITGDDEFFQFIINKAKVSSENTITLEAEGDPSTFSMTLTVLRPDDGSPMMQLVKYDIADNAADGTVVDASTEYESKESTGDKSVNKKNA